QEMARLNVDIPESAVDEAYANFAKSNNISTAQLDQALAQSGVTKKHFKEFIRSQIGWSRVLQARLQSQEQMSEQEAVQRMLQQGGTMPSATEYMRRQLIIVSAEGERHAVLAKRKREAQSPRDRFQTCANTREFAEGRIEVTGRGLGRVLEPALPPDWK